MPKPSAFAKAVRKRRIRANAPSNESRPVDLRHHDLQLAPHSGRKLEELAALLEGDCGHTRQLLSATLPQPRSTLDSKFLQVSSFIRLVLWARPHYFGKDSHRLRAIVHAEVALSAPVDLDPDDPYRERTVPLQQMVMTLRVLDVHVQPQERADADYINEVLGWSLSDQLLGHANELTNAFYDYQDGYRYVSRGEYRDLIRFELQGERTSLFVAQVIDNAERFFHKTCKSAHNRYQLFEWLDLKNSVDLLVRPVDAEFEDALAQGITSRKSAEKPKRERAAPNAVHHLLLRTDPVLRISKGKVIHLGRLADIQTKAADLQIETFAEAHALNDDEVDWGPSYEERLEAMSRNAKHERLEWVFVIDDGTQVFSAFPVPASELTIDRILDLLDVAWKGDMGMLRGPPTAVSLPTAYATDAERIYLDERLRQRGVALKRPASGFDTPLHVGKIWCEHSNWIEPWSGGRSPEERRPPATMSLQYVADWAFAHLLSNHANSYYFGLEGRYDAQMSARFAFAGGGFASMTSIRVVDYLDALQLGPAVDLLNKWNDRCHPRFQSDPADPVE